MFFWLFSGGNDYYRELNEQDYDMMLDDTPRGTVIIIIFATFFGEDFENCKKPSPFLMVEKFNGFLFLIIPNSIGRFS